MDTTFIIKKDELDILFLENLKNLYKSSKTLEINVSPSVEDENPYNNKEEYIHMINSRIEDLQNGEKITFTIDEFEKSFSK